MAWMEHKNTQNCHCLSSCSSYSFTFTIVVLSRVCSVVNSSLILMLSPYVYIYLFYRCEIYVLRNGGKTPRLAAKGRTSHHQCSEIYPRSK